MSSGKSGAKPHGLVAHQLLVSAMSTGAATCCTHPIDTCKSLIQLHRPESPAIPTTKPRHPPSLFRTMYVVARHEHPARLFRGLTAALARVSTYSATRLGMYGPFKEVLRSHVWRECAGNRLREGDPVLLKISAGALSGSCGAVIGNPFELVKVRLQGNDHGEYRGLIHALKSIAADEGVGSLWRGVGPAILRASLLTASQLVTYDEAKHRLQTLLSLSQQSVILHILAGLVSGLVTTTVINPVDVIKTLAMNSRFGHDKSDSLSLIMRSAREHLFWRGWTANYARIGPHILITMVVYEKLAMWTGLKAF